MNGTVRDMLHAYMAGWGHGASDRRRDMDKFSHEPLLHKQYVKGHAEGRKVREAAEAAVTARMEKLTALSPAPEGTC